MSSWWAKRVALLSRSWTHKRRSKRSSLLPCLHYLLKEDASRSAGEGKRKFLSILKRRPSPVPYNVAYAAHYGATRNVYLGGIDDCFTEGKLLEDFKPFGAIELINIIREKYTIF